MSGETNWQLKMRRSTKMDMNSFFLILKLLWWMYEVVSHYLQHKRNKALETVLEKHNQRLIELEKVVKELKP